MLQSQESISITRTIWQHFCKQGQATGGCNYFWTTSKSIFCQLSTKAKVDNNKLPVTKGIFTDLEVEILHEPDKGLSLLKDHNDKDQPLQEGHNLWENQAYQNQQIIGQLHQNQQ